MPDIFNFDCDNWKLTVWTGDNQSPQQLLTAVLNERGRQLSTEKVCLSFKLTGSEQVAFDGVQVDAVENSSSLTIPSPLCYENRNYEFEFKFKKDCRADASLSIVHRLKEIEQGFRVIDHQTVRGLINFKNNAGWFKLCLRYHNKGVLTQDSVSFKVLPTKLDMDHDLDEIGRVIDSIYPLWRFTIAQKTDTALDRSPHRHESFELLWIAQFKSLCSELVNAIKLICRSPHSRLLADIKRVKAEKIKTRIAPGLQERIKADFTEGFYDKRYLIKKHKLSHDTPENRFVKMVLLYCIKKLRHFHRRVENLKVSPEQSKLSQTFYDELSRLVEPFETLSAQPLFHEIGKYDGRMRESLVLHQRSGYNKVYRIWQQLKLYLEYFGNDASISVRSVEQLYEIWCLLEVRRILITLGFSDTSNLPGNLKTTGLEKQINDEGTFRLSRCDGMKAILVHEPHYSSKTDKSFGRIYSWTTAQRPDIFLEVTMPCGDKVRWVFDAKYRIDANDGKTWPSQGIDTVPDDAINQMHRYRDALIYISEADENGAIDKSRPVIGAFALYPGWFKNQQNSLNPYREAIEEVGIGAFPLLPGCDNHWLTSFLESQLGLYTEMNYSTGESRPLTIKEADEIYMQEPVRIVTHGMKQHRYNGLVLTANIYEVKNSRNKKDESYTGSFKDGGARWYHIPEKTIRNKKISRHLIREIRYCAFSTLSPEGRSCRYIYPVENVVLKPRGDIDRYAGGKSSRAADDELYWLIKLGKAFQSPVILTGSGRSRKFTFNLVEFQDFLQAQSWDELPMMLF